MNTKEHYNNMLADYYTWFQGGLEGKLIENRAFFDSLGIKPKQSGIAIDLGAGSGFQSIPLAQIGYSVISIDLSEKLLSEIQSNGTELKIITINDNILNFKTHVPPGIELCVCMGDTLTHLNSSEEVEKLLIDVFSVLENQGKLILSFRDLSLELIDLDRIIPVRSNETKIFTCFLEYEQNKVKVNDILYEFSNGGWQLKKSFYRKLRLSDECVLQSMSNIGYNIEKINVINGMVEIIAYK